MPRTWSEEIDDVTFRCDCGASLTVGNASVATCDCGNRYVVTVTKLA